IGSDTWWQHYDAGRISRTEHVGQVTHIGPTTDDFDETCDIVRIRTDRREIEYDRDGFWLDPALVVGKWLHIECVEAIVQTRTGPVRTIVDLRGGWMAPANKPLQSTGFVGG
ncbi:MAG TPA: hypothetical protein VIV12_05260, partial [Streptosporangiaceae bacterium]